MSASTGSGATTNNLTTFARPGADGRKRRVATRTRGDGTKIRAMSAHARTEGSRRSARAVASPLVASVSQVDHQTTAMDDLQS
jgi:hypothetical protein